MAIYEIRPRSVFELLESKFPNTNVELNTFVPMSSIGSLLLLESAVLVSLSKVIGAQQIFEFGTYMGGTSATLAKNLDAEIWTLDIEKGDFAEVDKSSQNLKDGDQNDDYLRQVFYDKGAHFIESLSDGDKSKIRQIYEDSRKLNIVEREFKEKFDLIFIDGGHDLETISNDTEKSLEMVKSDSIILWHDFRSKIHGDVTKFMDTFGKDRELVHVQNTMLVMLCQGEYKDFFKSEAVCQS